MRQPLVTVLFAVVAAFTWTGFQFSEAAFINLKVYENEWLRKVLTEPLNNVHVRPTVMNTSEPIEISVSLVVRNFEVINAKEQEYTVQITLRQEWEDDRLAYAKFNPVQLRQIKYLTLVEPDKIWTPDTFFKNEKRSSIHNIMKPNNFARIFSNGTVRLETRISLTLACPMNLRYFPFEHTTCNMQIASYGFARDDLIYKWRPQPPPITIRSGAAYPQEFVFDSITSNYCDAQSGNGGVFSCLLAEFHFRRNHFYYLKQNFIPLTNLVIVSWFSFLLDYRRTLLLRALLCMLTYSTAFSLLGNVAKDLPRTRTTALDWWNGISLTFIFAALVELVFVHYVTTVSGSSGNGGDDSIGSVKSSKRNSAFDSTVEMEMIARGKLGEGGSSGMSTSVNIEPENVEVAAGERKKSVEIQTTTHWTSKVNPDKIERWIKVLYPAVFAGFNLIFWLVCSNSGVIN